MFIIYRILTLLLNCFLLFGISVSIYEVIVGGYSNPEGSVIISLVFTYVVLSSSYFIWKTRKIRRKTPYSTLIDQVDENSYEVKPFRLSWIIGFSNILIGLLFILAVFYILVRANPMHLETEDLLRLLIVGFGLFYGSLKIYYAIYVLSQISKSAKK